MFPALHTDRLFLLAIEPADQPFIFEGLSHPDVIPFYGVRYESFEATAAQMAWYKSLEDEGTGIAWKLVEKASGEAVGVMAVYAYQPAHRKAEVGFWLLPRFWRKGFALEALQEVVRYWQTEKGLHRLEAFVEEGNNASSRLLLNGGFCYEGLMRDCEIKNGKYISLRIYSKLTSTYVK